MSHLAKFRTQAALTIAALALLTLSGCVAYAPGYGYAPGYAPAPAYVYAPAPVVVGGYGGWWGGGWHHWR